NIRIGFLEQINVDIENILLKDYLEKAYHDIFQLQKELENLEEKMKTQHDDKTLNQYDRLQTEFIRRGGYNIDTEIHTLLTKFGFAVEDLNRNIQTFSGGQITRLG